MPTIQKLRLRPHARLKCHQAIRRGAGPWDSAAVSCLTLSGALSPRHGRYQTGSCNSLKTIASYSRSRPTFRRTGADAVLPFTNWRLPEEVRDCVHQIDVSHQHRNEKVLRANPEFAGLTIAFRTERRPTSQYPCPSSSRTLPRNMRYTKTK